MTPQKVNEHTIEDMVNSEGDKIIASEVKE
jgi:hypothetical protein